MRVCGCDAPGPCQCSSDYLIPTPHLFGRYAHALSRRGLHRTALEVCKLLLSLDAEDPLGACLCIDYYALRAGQPEFVPRLAAEFRRAGAPLSLLPNAAFSAALARRRARRGAEADEALLSAVLTFPSAVRPLVERAGRVDGAWAAVLAEPLFAEASCASATLTQLVSIFVERHHALWKEGDALDWLRSAAEKAATAPTAELPGGLSRADWAAAREEAYPACAVSAYQGMFFLSSFSDSVDRLPPEEMQAMQAEAEAAAVQRQLAAAAPERLEGGTLRALLRSLLPWANVGEAPDYEGDAQEQG